MLDPRGVFPRDYPFNVFRLVLAWDDVLDPMDASPHVPSPNLTLALPAFHEDVAGLLMLLAHLKRLVLELHSRLLQLAGLMRGHIVSRANAQRPEGSTVLEGWASLDQL